MPYVRCEAAAAAATAAVVPAAAAAAAVAAAAAATAAAAGRNSGSSSSSSSSAGQQQQATGMAELVAVRLGPSLAPLHAAGLLELTGIRVLGWDRAANGSSSNSTAGSSRSSTGSSGSSTQSTADYGVTFVGVPHLLLRDSTLADASLSGVAPLVVCENCTFLTVERLTVEGLEGEPLVQRANGIPSVRQVTHGAVAANGLAAARLVGVSCSRVVNSYGFACVRLSYLPLELRRSALLAAAKATAAAAASSAMAAATATPAQASGGSVAAATNMSVAAEDLAAPAPAPPPAPARAAAELALADVQPPPLLLISDSSFANNSVVCTSNTSSSSSSSSSSSGASGVSGAYGAADGDAKLRLSRFNASSNDVVTGSFESGDGGAVYMLGGGRSSVTITDGSIITSNQGTHGGAVYTESSASLLVEVSGGSRLALNRAGYTGGAISAGGKQDVAIRVTGGSSLSRNVVSGYGGAILAFAKTGSLVVSDQSSITGNVANLYGPSTDSPDGGCGGGAWLEFQNTTLIEISGGSAVANNGAINNGGGLYVWKDMGTFILNGSRMSGNVVQGGPYVTEGGALFVDRSAISIILDGGAVMSDNKAGVWGGAIGIEANGLGDGMVQLGRLVVKGGSSVTGNSAGQAGGAIYLGVKGFVGAVELLEGSRFINNTARDGGGVFYSKVDVVNVTMHGVLVSENGLLPGLREAAGSGTFGDGGVSNVVAVTITNSTITHNVALFKDGGALWLGTSAGTLRLAAGTLVSNNHAAACNTSSSAECGPADDRARGGAIWVGSNAGAVVLEGGTVAAENEAGVSGGFLYVGGTLGSLRVDGGSAVRGNRARHYVGGAVFVALAVGSVEVAGGSSVTGNVAQAYGGFMVAAARLSSFTISGGSSITYNRVLNGSGGVLAIERNVSSFAITGGSDVSYNAAVNGSGGVLYAGNAVNGFMVSGSSTCAGNTAGMVGGMVAADGLARNVSISGGSRISDCAAANYGGFVHAEDSLQHVTVEASTIQNCTAGVGGGAFSSGGQLRNLTLAGGAAVRDCAATDTSATRTGGAVFVGWELEGLTLTGGSSIEGGGADQGGGVYVYGAAKRVSLAGGSSIRRCTARLGGALFVGSEGLTGLSLTGGSSIGSSKATSRGGCIYVGASAADAGSLGADGGSSSSNSDGGSSAGSSSGSSAHDMRGVVLADGSEIAQCTAAEGGAVYVAGGAATDWRLGGGATIRNNRASLDGGAVWAAAAGDWLLEGNSSISENSCGRDGGAVYISDGTFSSSAAGGSSNNGAGGSPGSGATAPPLAPLLLQLTLSGGGRVSSNRAERFGGACFLKGTGGLQLLNVTGAGSAIASNQGLSGGAFYVTGAVVQVSVAAGGAVTGNRGTGGDGGFLATLQDLGRMEVTGAGSTLSDNVAGFGNGGAVFVTGGAASVVVADGAEVSGNRARFGGALAVKGRVVTFELTGRGAAASNYAAYSGAVLHAGGGAASVRMSGGARAAGNRAGLHGGVLWAAGVAEVVMSGGVVVEGNRAVLGAGGVLAVEGAGIGRLDVAGGCDIRGNQAATHGGFVFSEDTTVSEAPAAIASASGGADNAETEPAAAAAAAVDEARVAAWVRLTGSNFTANTAATGNGGGLAFGSAAVAVVGCAVANNAAPGGAGGFLFLGRQWQAADDAAAQDQSLPAANAPSCSALPASSIFSSEDSTYTGNHAGTYGGAVALYGNGSSSSSRTGGSGSSKCETLRRRLVASVVRSQFVENGAALGGGAVALLAVNASVDAGSSGSSTNGGSSTGQQQQAQEVRLSFTGSRLVRNAAGQESGEARSSGSGSSSTPGMGGGAVLIWVEQPAAAAGVAGVNSSLILEGCEFQANAAWIGGGGDIAVWSTAALQRQQQLIAALTGMAAAAVAAATTVATNTSAAALAGGNQHVRITDSTFVNSSAVADGGSLLSVCGCSSDISSTPAVACSIDIRHSTFKGATAGRDGGALALAAGAAAARGATANASSTGAVSRSTPAGLATPVAAAVELESCRFEGNAASGRGGAISYVELAPPGASTAVAPCDGNSGCNSLGTTAPYARGLAGLRLRSSQLLGNRAKQGGGAVALAEGSTALIAGSTLGSNSAPTGPGGAVLARGCNVLWVDGSAIADSRTLASTGGGIYAAGCSLVLVNGSRLSGNSAANGGGMFVSPATNAVTAAVASGGGSSSGSSSSTTPQRRHMLAGDTASPGTDDGFSALIVLDTVFANNSAILPAAPAADDTEAGGAGVGVGPGKGGGVFVQSGVSALFSNTAFTPSNAAASGSALASTQHCSAGSSNISSSSSGLLEDLVRRVSDAESRATAAAGVSEWRDALYTAHQQGAAGCSPLLLVSTAVPPSAMLDEVTQRLPRPVWMEDANMTALAAWCEGSSTNTAESSSGGSRSSAAAASTRVGALLQTLAQCSLPQLSANELATAAAAAVEFPPTQLRLQLPCSMIQGGGSSGSSSKGSSTCFIGGGAIAEAAAADGGSSIGLQQPRSRATATVSVLPEEPFAMRVQLVDAHGGATTPVASTYKVTLSLRVLPPPSAPVWSATSPAANSSSNQSSAPSSSGAAAPTAAVGTAAWLDGLCASQQQLLPAADAAWWWCDPDFANLDVGRAQSLTQVLDMGSAEWPRVLLRGWPGDYLLVLRATGPLQVAELSVPLEPQQLQQLTQRAMAGELARAYDGSEVMCKECPNNADCPGGRAIVPLPGYWHSAPNSAAVHACHVPDACLAPSDVAFILSRSGFGSSSFTNQLPPPTVGSSSTSGDGSSSNSADGGSSDVDGVDQRTQALLACQSELFTTGAPPYGNTTLGWGNASSATAGCSLELYMQMQCGDGYTGNLCAACLPGYAVSQDLECDECPSMARTLGLSLLAFFGSVALIMYTAVASLGAATAGASEGTGVTQGDIMKILIVHCQYTVIITRLNIDYPHVITTLKAGLGSITGAASQGISFNYGCLVARSPTGQRALAQLSGSLLVPCVVIACSLALWALRYKFLHRAVLRRTRAMHGHRHGADALPSFNYYNESMAPVEEEASLEDGSGSIAGRGDSGRSCRSRGSGREAAAAGGHALHGGCTAEPAAQQQQQQQQQQQVADAAAPPHGASAATAAAAAQAEAAAAEAPMSSAADAAGWSTEELVLRRQCSSTSHHSPTTNSSVDDTPLAPASLHHYADTQQHDQHPQQQPAPAITPLLQPAPPAAPLPPPAAPRPPLPPRAPSYEPGAAAAAAAALLPPAAAVAQRTHSQTSWQQPTASTHSDTSQPPQSRRASYGGGGECGSTPQNAPATPSRLGLPSQHPPPPEHPSSQQQHNQHQHRHYQQHASSAPQSRQHSVSSAQQQHPHHRSSQPGSRHASYVGIVQGPSLSPSPSTTKQQRQLAQQVLLGSNQNPAPPLPTAGSSNPLQPQTSSQRPSASDPPPGTSTRSHTWSYLASRRNRDRPSDGGGGGGGAGPRGGRNSSGGGGGMSERVSHVSNVSQAMRKLGSRALMLVKPRDTPTSALALADTSLGFWQQLGLVLMSGVFVLYAGWAQAAFSVFSCYRIDEGGSLVPENERANWSRGYWFLDMQQPCYSGTHMALYLPIGIVSVCLFCLAPPLSSFLLMWRARHRLAEYRTQQMWGFMYKRYRQQFFFWESILQLQTLALVAVDVFGRGMPVLYQALLLLAVLLSIASINMFCAPLRTRRLVVLEFSSHMVLCLTITLSLYFIPTDALPLSDGEATAVGAIMFALNICLLAAYVAYILALSWPSFKPHMDRAGAAARRALRGRGVSSAADAPSQYATKKGALDVEDKGAEAAAGEGAVESEAHGVLASEAMAGADVVRAEAAGARSRQQESACMRDMAIGS
ncbi:hypothetical protein HYH02_008567 [Chlamydomonas schloesseri]|uniref:Right handed beta helix domain-containing protein n=1 Tax=Chlamydomonas schloesseri TaxID=2026947 RepID=A0A835WFP3_9CHLO|nr:hypothetical protein HYH02_008567 [Chlamydomonas schloesseri]|eukprot:KAG2446582.1 hypothetical protein HYH02_008567 [Chlamydomonas schloesseri]